MQVNALLHPFKKSFQKCLYKDWCSQTHKESTNWAILLSLTNEALKIYSYNISLFLNLHTQTFEMCSYMECFRSKENNKFNCSFQTKFNWLYNLPFFLHSNALKNNFLSINRQRMIVVLFLAKDRCKLSTF